jgi:hypothetical protein
MTFRGETYLDWVKEGYFWASRALFFMAKGMIEELGEEKGKELFVKSVYKMGEATGKQARDYYDSQGRDNDDVEEWFKDFLTDSSVFTFAWTLGMKDITKNEAVVDYLECPFADGFKAYGSEGIEIGELFCQNIDNANTQGHNPRARAIPLV